MATERVKRKIAAILSADVVGYSKLMEADEEATVRTIESYRKTITSIIEQHDGRVIDSPGDNILTEFGSVVDAVQCAVEIQHVIKAKNVVLPEARRMEFRIGINLGDVIEEGDRIYGDGINIAARIEGLADAGGICISGSAYEQIESKLALGYEDIGEHSVKNISKPVHVYRIPLGYRGVTESDKAKTTPFADKPSIAVLPFDNMSGDSGQEFLSDGLTEQIITGISKIPSLFVIARNSTFAYKGKAVKVQQIAQELGVRYLLEGSVQQSGDRVRINAQLIDAPTGHHLWAESYDRILEDIFAIQDDITIKIMEALQLKLFPGELHGYYTESTESINAYISYLQGLECFFRMTSGDNFHALKCFEEALAMDQNYSLSYAMLAYAHLMGFLHGWSAPIESLEKAEIAATKAMSLNDSLELPLIVLSQIHLFRRQHDKSTEYGERSIALNPNNPDSHAMLALVLYFSGEFKRAISLLDKAFRLNPVAPFYYFHYLGHPHLLMGEYSKAIEAYKKAFDLNPNFIFTQVCLAACYIATGNDSEAGKAVAKVLDIDPEYSIDKFIIASPHRDPSNAARMVDLLSRAGFK